MSKFTLDEAIKHCEEVAEQNEAKALRIGRQYEGTLLDREAKECRECAADHRQLAEWLRELNDLREENKVLTSECDRLIKEKGKLLKKSEQIAEYKRLLEAAVKDFRKATKDCTKNFMNCGSCPHTYTIHGCVWRYTGKALALVSKKDGDTNGV